MIANTPGKLCVISAPSGAGKTTLVKELVARRPELRFSVSYTTRPQRDGEVDGQDYFFVQPAEFEKMVADDEFLEHAEVFGNSYGTGKAQVSSLLFDGHDVLLEIDWQGAAQVRANLPECVSIFVLPPSLVELERRLRGRSTDSEAVIQRRLGEALDDLGHWPEFDFAVVNDQLTSAVLALTDILDGGGAAHATDQTAVRRRAEAILLRR